LRPWTREQRVVNGKETERLVSAARGVGCAADSTAGAGKIMTVAGKVTGTEARVIKAEEKAVVARACASGLPVGTKRASAFCISEWTVKTNWQGRADWGRAAKEALARQAVWNAG